MPDARLPLPRLAPLALLALAGPLAAPAAAGEVVVVARGTVSALAPPPTSGLFSGAQVGDAVELRLEAFRTGTPIINYPGLRFELDEPASTFRVGGAVDTLWLTTPEAIALYDGYLGLRDWFSAFDKNLAGGGHVDLALIDGSQTAFATPDLLTERGVYPAAAWSTTTFGAQVGGGFIEIQFESLEIGSFGPGTVVCAPSVPNSRGIPAILYALGSDALAANDLALRARGLPLNTFGFFLVSDTQAVVLNPGGSEGTLCLGGAIGRYQNLVQNSGASGEIGVAIDNTQLARPNGPVAALVGETWTFQAWYRDANPTPTSNFTDALAITYQ